MANVTSRDLAKELGISHGNLEYHFPNKELLLLAIYDQMKEEMSRYYLGQGEDIVNPMAHFHKLLVRLEDFQHEYRFFCLDIMEICRKYSKVNQDLENNMRIRKTQMSGFFERFLSMEYIKPEPVEGYYERLRHTIRILLTFWKSQEIVIKNLDFSGIGEMATHVWELLIPHLTKNGLDEYAKIRVDHYHILKQER
jgi:AcrR family transcriptional regulator